jgi:hypothetical protein
MVPTDADGMLTEARASQLLNVAKASPDAVARHDKAAWVGLFSTHAVIEDPIGSRPHHNGLHDRRSGVRGAGPIERFYDTFIAPNAITFHVDQDIVSGRIVIRDLTVEIAMAAGLTVRVPMHLLYEITDEDGALRIAHLCASWELFPMVRQVLSNGWPGLMVMNRLGLRMVANQGLGAVMGFCQGMFGIHDAGKETVRRFVEALNRKEATALASLFAARNDGIAFPAGRRRFAPESFCNQVDVSLSVMKLLSAGYVTSCSFTARVGEMESKGVGFFEFNSRTGNLHAARLYCAALTV